DLVKAAYLGRMHIRRAQAIASMVIDRILGLLGLFVLSAIADLVAWRVAAPSSRWLIMAAWLALVLGLVALASIFAGVLTRPVAWWVGSYTARLSTILDELNAMSATYRRRLDVVLAGLGLSILSHALNVLVFFLIGRMLFPVRMTTTLAQH